MYDVSAIKNYILFLKKTHDLTISLHLLDYNDAVISCSELMAFHFHDQSYCVQVKTCPQAWHHCIAKQAAVKKKCDNSGSYIGTCHAGVTEFVYPISNSRENIGFISISGYKSVNAESYIHSTAKKFNMDVDSLLEAYSSLKVELPDKQYIDTLIKPLCDMLELAYIKSQNEYHSSSQFLDAVDAFIRKYHTHNITSSDICKHFSCSRSYLSSQFNRHFGKSIREYINELRIEDAKSLLKYSKLSVTEIAFSVGFTDSNYFSHVFKKSIGISPLQYRKNFSNT